MLRIEGNIMHQSQNSHLIINSGRKRAIKSVSEDKRKIPHTVFGVCSTIIYQNFGSNILKPVGTGPVRELSCNFGIKINP